MGIFKEITIINLEKQFANHGYNYSLFDYTGKLLLKRTNQSNAEFTIKRGELYNGLYFLEIEGITKLRAKLMIVE